MSTVEILSHDSELQDVLIRAGRLREDGSFIDLGARLLRPGEAIVVGSAAGADLVLAEDTVSQRHLRLEHERTHVLASELGSKNGTEPWKVWKTYTTKFPNHNPDFEIPGHGMVGRFDATGAFATLMIDENRIGHFQSVGQSGSLVEWQSLFPY